jgi:hypothetical protein
MVASLAVIGWTDNALCKQADTSGQIVSSLKLSYLEHSVIITLQVPSTKIFTNFFINLLSQWHLQVVFDGKKGTTMSQQMHTE